jgi:glycosyltransferase involved in cell wall biosynthesis
MIEPKISPSPQPATRLFAVIVMYKIRPHESLTLRTLLAAAGEVLSEELDLGILIWDNTPGGQNPGEIPNGVRYEAAPTNPGLARAYNRALEIARAEGYDWLLTLDQDSVLPSEFLIRVSQIAQEIKNIPSIAAIVPQITGNKRTLSPFWFSWTGIARRFNTGFTGVPSQAIIAFNSASTIRVTALRQIGGYNPLFWLDSSDHYMFRELHRHGKRVFVAGDIDVAHQFSMMDLQARVTPARYRNILLAESAFWDMELGALAGLERTARLMVRVYRHLRRNDSPELRAITYEFLVRRLFWTRRSRLRAWKAETQKLITQSQGNLPWTSREGHSFEQRGRVSVCMAAYNGEPYVETQIQSILNQLHEHDEVIVVDDGSKDRTRDIIRSFNDERIRLIEHPGNCGVVVTFEDAVRNATGDILFLADDDDIWAPNKVKKVLEAFHKHPEAQIVTSRISLIDQHGLPSIDPIYRNRKTFHSGFWQNILRNHFQGSAMAFRSSLLHSILPFPRHVEFLHDHWIGTRNAMSGGSVVYIDEPLLFYRRHSQNFSRKMNRARQVKARLQSLWNNLLRHLANNKNWRED